MGLCKLYGIIKNDLIQEVGTKLLLPLLFARIRVIGVSVVGATVVAISWAGFELPRDRTGNLGLCGRRSSETGSEDDGTDRASSRLRPDSLNKIC